jgi:hypothetical protein
MNRVAIGIAVILVVVIAGANVMLGQRLILPYEVVLQRGAGVPWYITWAMVWVSVGCAAALGLFLLSSLGGRSPRR